MKGEARQDGTADAAEIAHFDALAETWWDPHGEMRALHMINPVRLGYIRDAACRHFRRDPKALDCLRGLRILDIGCGAGVLSEPLARIGAAVVGADAAETSIEVAKRHAAGSGLDIDYRAVTAEVLADAGERFDIVLAMEVVEHVADVDLFVRRCAEMIKAGGLMIVATINRTLKSFALAIVGAEYILRLLPRGTHHWDKLVRPDELETALEENGLKVVDERGVILNIFTGEMQLSDDVDVNYMVVAERPA
ncbi:MAG: bifunctional 2-polyprenyl-6-hydroxyphenol methylase/3-demethylubiquinol 3-O-methyltransferase UbiG [Xanthobacteraceae bacterium]|jgi:2-polyprenyl-6-hydroxyphenyl methylase / 3-demethylubiquinone-9 3-methyltransferase